MQDAGDVFAHGLLTAITQVERMESAAILRYLKLMARVQKGEKIEIQELQALGIFSGSKLLINIEIDAWDQKATKADISAGGGFGGFTVQAGYSVSTLRGQRSNYSVQCEMIRIIKTESMEAVFDAMGPLPHLDPVGQLDPGTIPLPTPSPVPNANPNPPDPIQPISLPGQK